MLKVICTLIGTFIGAGFASGKEIYLFFFKYQVYGILGIIVSAIFIGYIIYKVLNISKRNDICNYNEFLNYLIKNKLIKIILINIIDVFLIISFCIMVSGFSAFIYQEFNINIIIGFIFMLICSYCAFKRKATGIIKINNILIPIIIFIIFFIVIKKVNLYELNFINGLNGEGFNINNWKIENFKFLIFSILYANYNLLTIIPIVVTMSNVTKNKKKIKYISIICSIIIFILSMSIFAILSQSNFNITNLEMPVVFIVGRYGIFYKYIYCLVVGIAIFTTAISVGYGYLQNYENNKEKYNKKIILLILCSIIAIPIGFSKLIELLYPIFGGIGLVQSLYVIKKKRKDI
jgi:uncharacterized membrane protein YkvI